MSITSMTFIFGFLPVALALFYISGAKIREMLMFGISILFYTLNSFKHAVLLIIVMLLTVITGRVIDRKRDRKEVVRLLYIIGIVINAGVLIFYKFISIAIKAWEDISSWEIQSKKVILPLGISFFTFKAISYLTDVYKGKVVPTDNPIHDALYLSFFPQIQAGPLSRYNDMLTQVKKFDFDLFSDGVCRFLTGFSKKILFADVLSKVSTEVFSTGFDNLSTAYAWLGSLCFSLQLYFDFSGYSSMAIGITEMFGYKCPENFDYPYTTDSVAGFWRRWHITLSHWFRDYVYIQLGGSRTEKKWRTYFNLLIVWILTGIWHGAAWNFIAWGLGYFVMISIEKMCNFPQRFKTRAGRAVYRVAVLLFINFQWVLFNSPNLYSGIEYIKRMVYFNTDRLTDFRTVLLLKDYSVFILIAVLLSTPVVPKTVHRLENKRYAYRVWECLYILIVFGAFAWSVSFVVAGQNNPFAYANF